MQQFFAFLRAINVGGRVVKMDRLRSILSAAGLRDVETFIASGNVIFHSEELEGNDLETMIEASLQRELGYEVATFVRTPAEVRSVAALQPFRTEGASLLVAFLKRAPAPAQRRALLKFRSDEDDLCVRGREAYWLPRSKISDSKFSGAVLERTLGMSATMRNVTTVRKLAARWAGD